MPISNYSELKVAIQDWTKRTDSLSVLDSVIDLAESDIWSELRIRDMETTTTSTTGTADRFIDLPTGYLSMRKLRLYNGGGSYEVNFVAPESMIVQPAAGMPKNFTVTSRIEFDRVPDADYTYDIIHYASPTPLSTANTSNAVLTRYPTVYLYGCLYHFYQWAQNAEMIVLYSGQFRRAVDRANKIDRRGRYHLSGTTLSGIAHRRMQSWCITHRECRVTRNAETVSTPPSGSVSLKRCSIMRHGLKLWVRLSMRPMY